MCVDCLDNVTLDCAVSWRDIDESTPCRKLPEPSDSVKPDQHMSIRVRLSRPALVVIGRVRLPGDYEERPKALTLRVVLGPGVATQTV